MRFVAYEGAKRAPTPIYNEKWPISLGDIVRNHGAIDPASMEHLLAGIDRFLALARFMEIGEIDAAATAAIREADNGADFMAAAAARGLNIRLLSGLEEAEAAAMGVLSCYPDAKGYVADLGGGSLELAYVDGGQIAGPLLSLPLGTAKLVGLDAAGWDTVRRSLVAALSAAGFDPIAGENLYMVGGSWRAVIHLHQHLHGYPLHILSRYRIRPKDVAELVDEYGDGKIAQGVPAITSQRIPLIGPALRMLGLLNKVLGSKRNISCPLGIREGLIHQKLEVQARQEDPLIASARFAGQRLSRGKFDGDGLARWMLPMFGELDEPGDARLRQAACLLADCAWHIHPDYRSAHALQIGLEGNFLGAGGRDRAMIARALWSAYGDSDNSRLILSQLAKRADLRRADKWGLAIRLGMRIDGGTGQALAQCRLFLDGDRLLLDTPSASPALRGEAIQHRLNKLALAMGKEAALIHSA